MNDCALVHMQSQLDKADLRVEVTLDSLRKQRAQEKVAHASTEVARGAPSLVQFSYPNTA